MLKIVKSIFRYYIKKGYANMKKETGHPKYIWKVYKDNQLRLLPDDNTISYFSNNSASRYVPDNLLNTGKGMLTVPESLPTDILAKRGILIAGFAEHTKGYYHSRQNRNFTDVMCVTKGVLMVKYNGKKVRLTSGEGLILPPNRLCDTYVDGGRTNVFWLHFKNDSYWTRLIGREIITKRLSRFDDIHSIMHVYLSEVYEKNRSLIMLESLADVLVELFKAEFASLAHNSDPLRGFGTVLQEIEKFPQRDWDADETADSLGMSARNLDLFCRRATGATFPKTVLKIRMRKALDMLKEGGLTNAQIAGKIGYSTPYSFSRIFKSFYGKSPQKFLS